MLSLTRKAGERILIGAAVVVEVLEVVGNRVRLGVQVPSGTSVRRGEVDMLGTGRPALGSANAQAPLIVARPVS
jgi:carbon storage regulator